MALDLTVAPDSRRFDVALALLRVIVGVVFMAHGGQKLFVYGFEGVAGAFGQMGVPFPGLTGPLVALVEFFGGLALVLGLLTPFAAAGLAATMLGATLLVHLPNGFFAPSGIEFTLTLFAAALTIALTGAGSYSVDNVIARRRAH